MFRAVVVLSTLITTFGFQFVTKSQSFAALNARSKSVPFLEQPAALKGNLPGEVGFDPLGLTSIWGDVSGHLMNFFPQIGSSRFISRTERLE
jgi:hypothetical protein